MGFDPFKKFSNEIDRNVRRFNQNFLGESYTGSETTKFSRAVEESDRNNAAANLPNPGDEEIEAAARAQRRRYGRAATMLTGGQGLLNPAPTVRRTLLGY